MLLGTGNGKPPMYRPNNVDLAIAVLLVCAAVPGFKIVALLVPTFGMGLGGGIPASILVDLLRVAAVAPIAIGIRQGSGWALWAGIGYLIIAGMAVFSSPTLLDALFNLVPLVVAVIGLGFLMSPSLQWWCTGGVRPIARGMAITLGLFGLEWLLLAFFTPAIESTPTQASVEAARGLMVVQACTGLVLMLCAAALYGAQVIGVIAVSIVLLAAPFINVAIAESYDVRNLRWVALLLIALAVVPIGWLGVFRERTARVRFAAAAPRMGR